jgi:hypothetical protein
VTDGVDPSVAAEELRDLADRVLRQLEVCLERDVLPGPDTGWPRGLALQAG